MNSSSLSPKHNNATTNENKREQVMVGTLPNDFLRLPGYVVQSQEEQDRAAAIHLQNQIIAQARQPIVGRLEVTIITATLNKNYGLTRMDPYVRLRIGRHVYETNTAYNGAKNPNWNKTFQIYNLKKEENVMHIEIYDENTLTEDERIAWTFVNIPECVYKGDPVDDWFKLSGKLGEDREGVIQINIAYTTGPPPMAPNAMVLPGYAPGVIHAPGYAPGVIHAPGYATGVTQVAAYGPGGVPITHGPGYAPMAGQMPIYSLPAAAQPHPAAVPAPYGVAQTHPYPQRTQPEISADDITQLQEMFPEIEKEVITSVLEASNGNKEFAINSLLEMQ